MNTLIFRNVHIRYADLRRKDESMPFTRLHLTSDLSSTICEAMDWEMPGDGQSDGSLIGKLTASHLILTPNEKGLKLKEIQIECSEAGDFKFVCTKDDEGEVTGTELRFILRSNQADAITIVNEYWRAVGESDAQMRLSYQKEPVQAKLEIAPAKKAADDEQPTLIDAREVAERINERLAADGATAELVTEDGEVLATFGEAAPTIEELRYPGSGNGCEAALIWRECEGGFQADYMVRFTVGTRDSRAAQLDGAPIRMSMHQAISGAATRLFEFCGEIIAKHESGNTRVTVRMRNEAQKLRNWLPQYTESQPGLAMKDEQTAEEVVIQ